MSVATHKTNQVSTVLLYDIPIVSLYIEGQERLCLAQISNTLLKQFSYNEIHNRRVALGITCVQCTPVQLEILRRTGAMPVSSRRCGMITRREAERLCKSFLGDNAPPRLPDDFAFNVHHKCAWGCRGSFLPSRYNSSRAKCIKCTLCGIFFSPNKFIFHSHRICASDKYIQPDAANFNSWRRHMMLSGQPHEEIVHAWEDVKAMFNGGTRKRLMSSHSSLLSSSATRTDKSPEKPNSDVHRSNGNNCPDPAGKLSANRSNSCLGAVTAVVGVGVAAVTQQLPIRPFNMRPSAAVNSNLCSSALPDNELEAMPFSRSFMMDYMWRAHTVHRAAHIQHQQNPNNNNSNFGSTKFPFPANGSLQPWMKTSGEQVTRSHIFGEAAAGAADVMPATNGNESQHSDCAGRWNNAELSAVVASSNLIDTTIFREPITSLPHIFNSSAFKPVNKASDLATVAAMPSQAAAAVISTSIYTADNAAVATSLPSSSASSSSTSPAMSSALSSPLTGHKALLVNRTKLYTAQNALLRMLPPVTVEAAHGAAELLDAATSAMQHSAKGKWFALTSPNLPETNLIKESHSSEEDELNSECDEMIDIETTEDEHQQTSLPTQRLASHQLCPKSNSAQLGLRKTDVGNSLDEIDVDGDSEEDNENSLTQFGQNCSNRIYGVSQQNEGKKLHALDQNNCVLSESLCVSSKRRWNSTFLEIVKNCNKNNEVTAENLLQKEIALN